MERHYHPLNPSQICCAEHAYEMCRIYEKQGRVDDIITVLISFSETVDTKFLLDTNDRTQEMKKSLASIGNQFGIQLVRDGDAGSARMILESGITLLSSLPQDTETMGILATTNLNLAYACHSQGEFEDACRFIEAAAVVEKKSKDVTGSLITRVNKAAVLTEIGAYHEAYHTAKEAAKLMEPKIMELIRSKSDTELTKNLRFIESVTLLIVTYINMISALRNNGDRKSLKEADDLSNQASKLALRFLGETHPITQRLAFPQRKELRVVRRPSGVSSSSEGFDKNPSTEISLDFANYKIQPRSTSIEEKKEIPRQNPLSHSESQMKVKREQSPSQDYQTRQRGNKQIDIDLEQSDIAIKQPIISFKSTDTEFEPPQAKKQIVKANESKPEIKPIEINKPALQKQAPIERQPQKPQAVISQPVLKTKIIRLPGALLPCIPIRPSFRKDLLKYSFSKDAAITDGSFLLNPQQPYFPIHEKCEIGQVAIYNSQSYLNACSLSLSENVPYATLSSSLSDSTAIVATESIPLMDLQKILPYLGIRDVLPYSMTLKFIDSFEKFAKWYLLPFMRMVTAPDNSKKIEIWGQSTGLLPRASTRIFLMTSCKVSLNYISNSTVRMILSNAADEDYGDKCIRIDMVFDDAASGLLLKKCDPIIRPGVKIIPSICPFDMEFLKQLDPILTEMELYVKDQFGVNLNFNQLCEKDPFLMIRATITGKSLEKTLWIIQDLRNKRAWQVRAKNLFKINSSGRHRKFECYYMYSYRQIMQNFGIKIDKTEIYERKMIAYYVLESLKLEGNIDMDTQPQEDHDDYDESIMTIPITSVMGKRYLIDNKGYQDPVTISLIGVGLTIIGVRATIYDVETGNEQGCLFPIDGEFYLRDKNNPVKKLSKHAQGKLHAKVWQETKFDEILEEQGGWDWLFSLLKFEGKELYITDLLGRKTCIESLETALFKEK